MNDLFGGPHESDPVKVWKKENGDWWCKFCFGTCRNITQYMRVVYGDDVIVEQVKLTRYNDILIVFKSHDTDYYRTTLDPSYEIYKRIERHLSKHIVEKEAALRCDCKKSFFEKLFNV